MTEIDTALTKSLYTLACYAAGRTDTAEKITVKALVHIFLRRKTAAAFTSCAARLYLEGKRVFERQPDMLGDYSTVACDSGTEMLVKMDYDERFLMLLRFRHGLSIRETGEIMCMPSPIAQRTIQKAMRRVQAIS